MDDAVKSGIDSDIARARRLLQHALRLRGLSQREVERHLGFSANSGYLSRIFCGSRKLKIRSILEVLEAIEISAGTFFRGLFPSVSFDAPARSIERELARESLHEMEALATEPEWLLPGIRRARVEDITGLQRFGALLPDLGFAGRFAKQESFESLVVNQRGIALVGVEGKEIVGFLHAEIEDCSALLWCFELAPSHRKYFGPALHEAYLSTLQRLGIARAGSFVSFDGQARQIMSELGYQRRQTYMWMERHLRAG